MDTPETKQMANVLMMGAEALGSVPGIAATALPTATIALRSPATPATHTSCPVPAASSSRFQSRRSATKAKKPSRVI